MKILKTCMVVFLFFIQTNAFSIEKQGAIKFVEEIGNQAIKILKIPVDDRKKRNDEFRILLKEKFDIATISKVILGKNIANSSSKQDLSTFNLTLEDHIVKVYTSQLGVYKGQTFNIQDTVIKNKDAFVYTSIDTGVTPSIRIVWRIREKNNIYKVIDIAVEGVSLLRTKRADFKVLLDTVGLKGLIEKLNELNSVPDPRIPGDT